MNDGERQSVTAEAAARGQFVRSPPRFRNWITADGRAGPSGEAGLAAAPGRYHLYVSYACPWAHRTLILRKLKRLEDMVSLSVVHWFMGEDGWTFDPGPSVVPDPVLDAKLLREVYRAAQPDYSRRITVPILWDRQRHTIVSNESSEIIRMFNSAFDHLGAAPVDFCPPDLRDEIDAVNAVVYDTVNNGAYKCGFARSQEAYDEAVTEMFITLDDLESRLGGQRYLVGDRLTEADWRLFTTLVRFDPVYYVHFKCNIRRIKEYPNLWNYLLELYQVPGVAETMNMHHIKHHYYGSHESINPRRIVPKGPAIDYSQPHDRGRLPIADG